MEAVIVKLNSFYSNVHTNPKYSKEYNTLIKSKESLPMNRFFGFVNLKYKFNLTKTGYTYVPINIKYNNRHILPSAIYYKEGAPEFVALSPSYESSKGEFRDTICLYTQVEIAYNKYSNILLPILDKLSKTEIEVTYDTFGDIALEVPENLIKKVIACAIFIVTYRDIFNQIQVHMHKSFIQLSREILEESIIYNNFKESKDLYNILFRSSNIRPYGQKLSPLTVGEVVSVMNITYRAWREVIIGNAISDMVLNLISPNFPIGTNWTYIESIDDTTFDNLILKDKLQNNHKLQTMINEYKQIYEDSSDVDNVEHHRQNLLYEISELHKTKLLSNIALCKIDEHVGITIGTIPSIIKNATFVPPHINEFISDIKMFDKYMFDILYGCHVLHKRVGAINFDLHLNNVTIAKTDKFYDTVIKDNTITDIKYNKKEYYHTLFILDGEDEAYLLPYKGFYGCVIDFSDAVVGSKIFEYTDKYLERKSLDMVIEREKNNIFDKLSSVLKYAETKADEIKGAIISDYDNMFKVIAAVDYIVFLRKLRMLFEAESLNKTPGKRDFVVAPKIMDRVKDMEQKSTEYMLQYIDHIINKDEVEIPFPGDALIPKFFKDYTITSTDNITVYEVYDFNAEWKYSSINPEHYPPWAKKKWLLDNFGKDLTNELIGSDNINMEKRDVHFSYLIEKMNANTSTHLMRSR